MLCQVNFLVLLYTRDIPYLLSALKSEPLFFGCEILRVIRCNLFYYFFCIYLFSFDGSKFRRVQPPGPNSKTSKTRHRRHPRYSLRGRRLEVVGERENGRARERHACLACLLLARPFFLVPSTSKRLLRRLSSLMVPPRPQEPTIELQIQYTPK